MVPLAVLGSIGVSLAVRVGVGLIASAARALLDAAPAAAEPAAGVPARGSFAAHLESAAGPLSPPSRPLAPVPPSRAMADVGDAPGRLAVEGGVQALALRVRLGADGPRLLASARSQRSPSAHSLRG